jgi:endoglucanase
MEAIWDNQFGYIVKEKLGCVFVGELGGRAVDKDAIWHDALAKYIEKTPGLLGNIAVWSLNANSGDTQGLVKDDWTTPEEHKLVYYRRMSPNPSDVKALEKKKVKPPVVTPTPPPSPQKYRVSVTELSQTSFRIDVLPK